MLTGGGIGGATLRELADVTRARRDRLARAVDVWWGDERFLPTGHPDRNETQAREALLDEVDLDPGPGAPDAGAATAPDGDDLDSAAERYADELVPRRILRTTGRRPLRRPAARPRPGRPCRVAVPGVAGAVRRTHRSSRFAAPRSRRRLRLSLSLGRDQQRPRGLADRGRRGEGRRSPSGAVRRGHQRSRLQVSRPGGDPLAARPSSQRGHTGRPDQNQQPLAGL